MDGYIDSRGTLLPRGRRAAPLALVICSALVLAACGGGGGGGGSSGGGSTGGGSTGGGSTGGGSTGGGTTTPPPPTNQAPTASAGADKTGNFPEAVSLDGSGTDPENATLTYAWTASGPGSATFTAATAADTNVTFSAPGTYTVTLSVNDGTNAAVTDSATVTVTAAYPTASGWLTATPADVGLDDSKLNAAITYATSAPLNFPSGPNAGSSDNGGSGVVIRYGKLVKSWGSTTQTYELKSTTKSIGGIALLLALDDPTRNLTLNTQGRTKLDIFGTPSTPANSDATRSQVTVGQLATHSGGFEKDDAPTASNDDGEIVDAPGTTWRYSDSGLNWLADVLTVTYDSDLNALLRTRVFDKLGIPTGQLTWRSSLLRTTPLTNPVTNVISARRELSSGMSGSVDAMARIGLLFLRKGMWGTEQIISSASVDLVQTPQSSVISLTNPLSTTFPNAQAHYGLLWWTNKDGAIPNLPTDAYWAWGLGESLIVVVPSLDLVIARAGVPDQQPDRGSNRAWNFGWDGKYSVLAPFLSPIGQAAGQ